MTSKPLLRQQLQALREDIPSAGRLAAETAMGERLLSLPQWQEAPLICGYVPIRGEPNTLPLLQKAREQGKTTALPVTITGAEEGRMIFRALPQDRPPPLSPARFGILEPETSCPSLSPEELSHALLLVPALAFDEEGYRLGYGGGYYDRFLKGLRHRGVPITTVGLVFSVCRVPCLPRQAHDIPVDLIIDERRVTTHHGT